MALLDFPMTRITKSANRLSVSMDIQFIRQPSCNNGEAIIAIVRRLTEEPVT